jgi:hypothetical protein
MSPPNETKPLTPTEAARKRLLDYIARGRGTHERRYKSNTRIVERANGTVEVILYETPVLIFSPENVVVLNSEGWRTPTTKARINEFLPAGFYLFQDRSEWYLRYVDSCGEDVFNFADGMWITAEGIIKGYALPDEARERARLRKRILKFCRAAKDALEAGEVTDPSGADCWFCFMREASTGKLMGERSGNTEHLEMHMSKEEHYIVPSLLWRAVETSAHRDPARIWAARRDYADTISRDLRKYLYEQFGLQRRTAGLRFTG